MEKLLKFTGLKVEPFWTKVYEKALKGKSVSDLLSGGDSGSTSESSGPAPVASRDAPKAEAPKKEEKGIQLMLYLNSPRTRGRC